MFDAGSKMGEGMLVYSTAKIVELHDRRLGLLYYGLVFLIAMFVVGYEILYCNDHFEKRDVYGTPRVNVQQPTVDGCSPGKPGCVSDFDRLTELPYCSEYRGRSTAVPPERRHPCTFADRHSLAPDGDAGGTILVPTRIDQIEERRGCKPSAGNGYACANEYETVQSTGVRYVADIDRYTLLISHTYQRDTISGSNNALMGYYLECDRREASSVMEVVSRALFGADECPGGYVRKPIPCLEGQSCWTPRPKEPSLMERVRESRAKSTRGGAARGSTQMLVAADGAFEVKAAPGAAPAAAPAAAAGSPGPPEALDVYAIPDGDVFSLQKLLRLAGISLDGTNSSDGEPLREAGTVLEIQVTYSNLIPFRSSLGDLKVSYEYKVTNRPISQVKEESVVWRSQDSESRTIENRHGVYVTVQVQGTFGFFSIVNFLLMLTTAAALLTMATVLTDKIALYVLKDRDFYSRKKYETAKLPDAGEGDEEQVPWSQADAEAS